MIPNSILLFVHPPFYKTGEEIFFDSQAQNGLRLWAENFDVVRVMAPLVETAPQDVPSDAHALAPLLAAHRNIEPVMMPRRGTLRFMRDLGPGKKVIRAQIAASQYLVFGFSGYIGDWGTVAARIATRMGRPYAVFKDGVAHRVARVTRKKGKHSMPRRVWHGFEHRLMKANDRVTVGKSTLALLHGQDTMEYYGRFASNPHLVHNIHISKKDRISQSDLEKRLSDRDPTLLKIAYAGRVEEIKGPDFWTHTIETALAKGVRVKAKWFGTGSLFESHRDRIAASNLKDKIDFMGFVPHKDMLAQIRDADLFLFTHMTEKSPRCLIEALSTGLPLVGFDSAYARNLVGGSKAGFFVPRKDTESLANTLLKLGNDPPLLVEMSNAAREISAPLNDEDVFRERSEIIKKTFGPANANG